MFNACLPAKSRFRHLRLRMTEVAGGVVPGQPYGLRDVRFVAAGVNYPVANMTTNNLPVPLVASASSENGGTEFAYHAFDGAGNIWVSASPPAVPEWLQIDLGASGAIRPSAIRINPQDQRWPSAFRVLGSNTGAFAGEERILYQTSGVTTGWLDNSPRTFTF